MAQTITAGVLQEAAKLHNDTDLLREIAGKDCVAIEVPYHKKCYLQYTKILTRKIKPIGATVYDNAFDIFCVEIIEQRIVDNKEIQLLRDFLVEFIKIVKKLNGETITYQSTRLKNRIQARYPNIVFHRSKMLNKGILNHVAKFS